jgi:hypothetical protein
MIQADLEYESIKTLCQMNRNAFYAIRKEAELRLKDYFCFSKKKEIKLNRPVLCSFWNKGYDFNVDRIFLNGFNVYVGGKNFNGKDTTEFFSYICDNNSLERIFDELSIF